MRARTGVVVALAVAFAAPTGAQAATYVVTRADDPTPGACNSDCSLREAVLAANAGAGGDTIVVPAGHFSLTRAGANEDAAATGDLDLTKRVTISGAGARATVIDGAGGDRVFDVKSGVAASIQFVAVTRGLVAADGGGIANAGSLSLLRTTVTGNAANGNGGGLESSGALTVTQSTVSGNRATRGGGIDFTGSLAVATSTIAANVAGAPGALGTGGGISGFGATTLGIDSSTIADNVAFNVGGAGGGLFAPSASLHNSIVADNLAHPPDQSASSVDNCRVVTLTSQGHNLSNGTDCALTGPGDRQSIDPRLSPLADNGGATDTAALLPGSPAKDSGDSCHAADQRELSRPRGPACDIGAYEIGAPVVLTAAATSVGFSSALLGGSVDPSLRATSIRFEYGTTTAYGSSTPLQPLGAGNGPIAVSAFLTGLRLGTSYHFRLVAANADGASAGPDLTFTTLDRVKPVLSLLKVTPGIFRAVRGTTISFKLSEDATVTFGADRVLPGARRGKRCLPRTRGRRRPPCTRYIAVKGSVVQTGKAGANSFHFDARLNRKRLVPGAYRLDAIPRDPSGNLGKRVMTAFRVRR